MQATKQSAAFTRVDTIVLKPNHAVLHSRCGPYEFGEGGMLTRV